VALDPESADDGAGTTDLSQWWAQVGPLLRKAVPGNVAVRASFPTRLPLIKVPPHWLTQAILNLLVNAGEAIPKSRRRGIVRLRAERNDDHTVRVEVTDNGKGMSAATQRRAFDLFFTTKPRSMGTGLGLPLARKVAMRAGGDVEIRSEPGRGTTVALVLPSMSRRETNALRALPKTMRGAISVRNHRVAALISQVLSAAGIRSTAKRGVRPGTVDLWVTEPTRNALASARTWRNRNAKRMIVLARMPSKSLRKGWDALVPAIIDPPNDLDAIRRTLGQAMAAMRNVPAAKARA
jgi:anti-sigma regulatory factor (Ser/Thr protein kinase)